MCRLRCAPLYSDRRTATLRLNSNLYIVPAPLVRLDGRFCVFHAVADMRRSVCLTYLRLCHAGDFVADVQTVQLNAKHEAGASFADYDASRGPSRPSPPSIPALSSSWLEWWRAPSQFPSHLQPDSSGPVGPEPLTLLSFTHAGRRTVSVEHFTEYGLFGDDEPLETAEQTEPRRLASSASLVRSTMATLHYNARRKT